MAYYNPCLMYFSVPTFAVTLKKKKTLKRNSAFASYQWETLELPEKSTRSHHTYKDMSTKKEKDRHVHSTRTSTIEMNCSILLKMT